MRDLPLTSRIRAFTLVETLVVVAIIALLAGIVVSASRSSLSMASRAKSAANLKNFGIAMFNYAADNNDFLPGSTGGNAGTLSGISPLAKSGAANSLQVRLMPYLEKDRPGGNWGTYFMKSLSYPAWLEFNGGTNDNRTPAYLGCQSYEMPDGTSISPFGGPSPTIGPMRLAALHERLSQIPPGQSKPYAVIEVDLMLYDALTWRQPSWLANLPSNALHGSARNVLYFDGSVSAVATNKKPYPW
jgi:prepilin-type N-terminal cleavage/methylation domain-containing protein/prepilin-type processing-associated H-X9-DG protein